MLNLTENEKRDIVRYIEEGKELPENIDSYFLKEKTSRASMEWKI